MRKISIGFSTPVKWLPFAEGLKWYMGQAFSHTYIGYEDEVTGQAMIAESSHGEFHTMTRLNWFVKNKIIEEFDIEADETQYHAIIVSINNSLQADYSILNIFGVPFYDLYEYSGIKFLRKASDFFIDGTASLICSESVSFTMAILGVQFSRPMDYIRPDHIYNAVINYKAIHGKVF